MSLHLWITAFPPLGFLRTSSTSWRPAMADCSMQSTGGKLGGVEGGGMAGGGGDGGGEGHSMRAVAEARQGLTPLSISSWVLVKVSHRATAVAEGLMMPLTVS